ncbi:IclR family transcriptional regulator [Phycicoccus endophyticus]|uniref:IclR family transcriptional regulator n=1 Tax=Phycicoccus endophyticus TaxID=1690220 RepID=A0A7G9QYV7_9MICO|nr:IclR family transcriptional regulator [Phycicoccus endophyticus]QNN48532.1 IclR family transcriptional regulator [Phycicoccus endophyticus]GGL31035.1 IclR family transcriptional regulator [Phycicoccus endophyticus]
MVPPPPGTQSVDRASDLVARVVRTPGPVTFSELAESSGLARSTTSRLLAALERAELLARDEEGGWVPGGLFDLYATRRTDDELLVDAAASTMHALNERTGETVNLGVARRGTVVQIHQVEAVFYLGSRDWVGTDVPAHCSALGKVLYAFDALPVPGGALDRLTPRSVTTSEELTAQLPGIRADGFAVTVDELEPGLTGIGAPVRRHGTVIAALGVSGPTFRLAEDARATAAVVAAHARAVSARLDHQPHRGAA